MVREGAPDEGVAAPTLSPRPPFLAVIDARGEAAWRVAGGISLAVRLVRSLELEGFREIRVVCGRSRRAEDLGARLGTTRAETLVLPEGAPLAETVASLAGTGLALVVDGALVVDRRLVRALRGCGGTVVVTPPDGETAVGLAVLDAAAADRIGRPLEPEARLRVLDPSSVSTAAPEMRGPMPILYRAVRTPEAAEVTGRALVLATQKHVMDAPARWIDPWVENALVARLAPTRITPNQITVGATLLGFVAAAFLWHRSYGVALALMYLVGWLDGCDGKLARLRLHYSPLGAGESYFDFAYENAWWIALAAGLAHAGHADAWSFGAILVVGNLLDEIAYTISQAKLGTSLDLLTPADGAFRIVAGRRNVYSAMLLVAVLAGSPHGGLMAMGTWAVVTGVVHTIRLVTALREPREQGLHA